MYQLSTCFSLCANHLCGPCIYIYIYGPCVGDIYVYMPNLKFAVSIHSQSVCLYLSLSLSLCVRVLELFAHHTVFVPVERFALLLSRLYTYRTRTCLDCCYTFSTELSIRLHNYICAHGPSLLFSVRALRRTHSSLVRVGSLGQLPYSVITRDSFPPPPPPPPPHSSPCD